MTQRANDQPSRRDLLRWTAAGALTSLAPFSYASYTTSTLSLERHELRLPKWDADGFRVALAADFHVNSAEEAAHAQRALQVAAAEKPDLIALPGDFVTYFDPARPRWLRQALDGLQAGTCPAVATLGNHDYSCRHTQELVATLKQSGVIVLRNEAYELHGVTVAGIDDGVFGKYDVEFLRRGISSMSLLALFHEPDYVKITPTNVSLQLSGHSHGGQICLPGGRPLHTPYGANTYYAGYYANAPVPLFVTRGVGTIGPKLRLFCPPEVTILTLRTA